MREGNEDPSPAPEMEFVDLRQRGDLELLREVYDRLFLPSILLPEERQSFETWTWRLSPQPPPPPTPYTTAVVAGVDLANPSRRRLAGYVILEHYRRSRVLLLAYIGVAPDYRRQGLMGRLLQEGFERARASVEAAYAATDDALRLSAAREPVRAAFAEIHVPGQVDPRFEPMETLGRVRAFAAAGARLAPIRYIQPALEPRQAFGRSLMLIALPFQGAVPSRLPLSVPQEFLTEYYHACGFVDPTDVAEYRETIDSLRSAAANGEPPAELEACAGAIEFLTIEPA